MQRFLTGAAWVLLAAVLGVLAVGWVIRNELIHSSIQVGNSVPPIWEVTSPRLAIVRMHGRNHETWNRKGLKAASDRFNHDYSEKELAEIARRVVELAEAVPVVHAVMNNNYEDQGQRNAKTLAGLLTAAKQSG